MILRGYTFKKKPKIKYESFENEIDEINNDIADTISLIEDYSKTKEKMFVIQNQIKRKRNPIPFLRTEIQCKLRKKSMTPSANQKELIQLPVKKKRTRNIDNFNINSIRAHNFTDLRLSMPNNFYQINKPNSKDQQSSISSTQSQSWRLKPLRYNKEIGGSIDMSAMHSTLLSCTNSIDEMEELENEDQSKIETQNLFIASSKV